MRKVLAVLSLVSLVACGGSKKTTTSTDMATTTVTHDMSATQTPDMATTPKGDASVNTTAIASACMNICHCFMKAADAQKCTTVCTGDDARYANGFSVTNSGGLGGSTSGSFSGIFVGGSSFTSGGSSTSGSGDPVVPPAACLSCLATATCASLEDGTACQNVCPYSGD